MFPNLYVAEPANFSPSQLALAKRLREKTSTARFEYIPPSAAITAAAASSRNPSPRRPRSLKSITGNPKPRVSGSSRASFESTRSVVSRAVSSVRKSRKRRQQNAGPHYNDNEGDGDDEREEKHTMTSVSAASEIDVSSHCHQSEEGGRYASGSQMSQVVESASASSHHTEQLHVATLPSQRCSNHHVNEYGSQSKQADARARLLGSSLVTSLEPTGAMTPVLASACSPHIDAAEVEEAEETIATPHQESSSSPSTPPLPVARSKVSQAKRRAILLERNWPVLIPTRKSSHEVGSETLMAETENECAASAWHRDEEEDSESSESPIDKVPTRPARSQLRAASVPSGQTQESSSSPTDQNIPPKTHLPPSPTRPPPPPPSAASFMERDSMVSIENEEDLSEDSSLPGLRTSRSSARTSANRYAWYLQDDEVSILSAVVERRSEESARRDGVGGCGVKQDVRCSHMDGGNINNGTKKEDSDKTPTLKAHRVSQGKQQAAKARNASGSSEDIDGSTSMQGHAWKRYQDKAVCGMCETNGALPMSALLVTTRFPCPSTTSTTPTTSTVHTVSSSTSSPNKPSTSSTHSRFPVDRIQLRRQEDIELTTDDLTLFDVMAREAYVATMKRQEQGRKRQELLSMRYELPIPKSPLPKRPTSIMEKKGNDGDVSDEGTGGKGFIEHRVLWNPSPASPRGTSSKWRLRLSSSSSKAVQLPGTPMSAGVGRLQSPPATPVRPKSLDRPRSARGAVAKPIHELQSVPSLPIIPPLRPLPTIPPLRPLPPLPLPFAMEAIAATRTKAAPLTCPPIISTHQDKTPTRHSFSTDCTSSTGKKSSSSSSTITPHSVHSKNSSSTSKTRQRKRSYTVDGNFYPAAALL